MTARAIQQRERRRLRAAIRRFQKNWNESAVADHPLVIGVNHGIDAALRAITRDVRARKPKGGAKCHKCATPLGLQAMLVDGKWYHPACAEPVVMLDGSLFKPDADRDAEVAALKQQLAAANERADESDRAIRAGYLAVQQQQVTVEKLADQRDAALRREQEAVADKEKVERYVADLATWAVEPDAYVPRASLEVLIDEGRERVAFIRQRAEETEFEIRHRYYSRASELESFVDKLDALKKGGA